jgi:hypothetical protein
MSTSVEADFDRLALLDDEGWTSNNHYHNSLLKHVPANCENALEIGSGTGAFRETHGEALQASSRARSVAGDDPCRTFAVDQI